jgi:beta-galactosidase
MAGVEPTTKIDDTNAQARLHRGAGGSFLWVTNPTRDRRTVKVDLSQTAGDFSTGEDIWGRQEVTVRDRQITVTVQGRDAAVIALR